ncbi:MAG: hypothetical protein HAW67_03915 [Endozoicomonadaceae bacterium]|nr:hypothetical protein [Endozoicomonadaceae bacterium]
MIEDNWIKVNSNSEVPVSLWLVKTKVGEPQIFNNGATHPKSKTIGHYFEFDEEVTMYWSHQLPLPPEEATEE